MTIKVGIPIGLNGHELENFHNKDHQPYRDRMNALYARGVKAMGNQDSVFDTHASLHEIMEKVAGLVAAISRAKQVAENPHGHNLGLELEQMDRSKILEAGMEICVLLFESAISEIERHASAHRK